MAQGSGLARGDRDRNRKLEALREAVARDRAVLAVGLGEDRQVAGVMDHECRVLARRVVKAKAHQLAALLDWGRERAVTAGFAGLLVACEPAGHRWKAGGDGAGGRGRARVRVRAVAGGAPGAGG